MALLLFGLFVIYRGICVKLSTRLCVGLAVMATAVIIQPIAHRFRGNPIIFGWVNCAFSSVQYYSNRVIREGRDKSPILLTADDGRANFWS